jgi:hypothetical protein
LVLTEVWKTGARVFCASLAQLVRYQNEGSPSVHIKLTCPNAFIEITKGKCVAQ